jgi:hypothetical protein
MTRVAKLLEENLELLEVSRGKIVAIKRHRAMNQWISIR